MRGWRRFGRVEYGRDAYAEHATKQGIARRDRAAAIAKIDKGDAMRWERTKYGVLQDDGKDASRATLPSLWGRRKQPKSSQLKQY